MVAIHDNSGAADLQRAATRRSQTMDHAIGLI